MIQLNLRQRLLLLTLVPGLLIGVLTIAFFTYGGIRALEAELRQHAMSTVRFIAPVSEYSVITGQLDNLQTLVQTTVQEHRIKSAMIFNVRGKMLAVAGRVSVGAEAVRNPPETAGVLSETREWLAYGAPIIRSLGQVDPLFDGEPASNEPPNEAVGYVVIEVDKTEVVEKQQALMRQALGLVAAGLAVIGTLSMLLADRLGRPLLRLVDAVRSIGQGRYDTRITPLSDGEMGVLETGFNDMAGHIEQIRDTMQQRIEEATVQLAFQATHDPLTGLYNRREFGVRLEKALAEARAGGDASTLLYLDLDRFKPVNDSCGHLAGDDLLQQIAQLLGTRLREYDTLARLGGDEFGVILHACHGAAARQVAEDLCELVSEHRFIWQDKVFSISASIGLTVLGPNVRSAKDVLSAADKACYTVKERGRNGVSEGSLEDSPERRNNGAMLADRIRSALRDNRMQAMCQPLRPLFDDGDALPLIELSSQIRDLGHQAMVLNQTIAEHDREGLSIEIQRRLIESAMHHLLRARERGKAFRCLIPVSPSLVASQPLFEDLEKLAARLQTNGQGIYLMLPEAALKTNPDILQEWAERLRNGQFGIAIEDFSGGLSGFNQLRNLRPEFLKLSASLTHELSNGRTSTALLRAIQEIADEQGIATIASQVNDSTNLGTIRELNIHYVQGLLSGPVEPFDIWIEGGLLRDLS